MDQEIDQMKYLSCFYTFAIIGLFSLLLVDSDQAKVFSVTTMIYMLAAVFGGLYLVDVHKLKTSSRLSSFLTLI